MASELPQPTLESVHSRADEFNHHNDTKLDERALRELRCHFKENGNEVGVYVKAVVLNRLYSTHVSGADLRCLARYIPSLQPSLDGLIDTGSCDAIYQIIACPGASKKYLSFASKYCSWHNPTAYPIYDGNVDECLWQYQKRDHFYKDLKRKYLVEYSKFVEILRAFREFYGLTDVDFRTLDKFLYLEGLACCSVPGSPDSASV